MWQVTLYNKNLKKFFFNPPDFIATLNVFVFYNWFKGKFNIKHSLVWFVGCGSEQPSFHTASPLNSRCDTEWIKKSLSVFLFSNFFRISWQFFEQKWHLDEWPTRTTLSTRYSTRWGAQLNLILRNRGTKCPTQFFHHLFFVESKN